MRENTRPWCGWGTSRKNSSRSLLASIPRVMAMPQFVHAQVLQHHKAQLQRRVEAGQRGFTRSDLLGRVQAHGVLFCSCRGSSSAAIEHQ